jgi:hypothetical protein
MDRREFIVVPALLLVPAGWLAGCGEAPLTIARVAPDHPEAEVLLRTFARDLRGVDFIGPECLQRRPEAGVGPLLQRLRRSGATTLETALQSAIATDFRDGRLEDVAGWQLSRTECELAALAALEQGLAVAATYSRQSWTEATLVEVRGWGPQATTVGEVFNPQPDGHAGLWIQADNAPPSIQFWFAGRLRATTVFPDVITSGLAGELLEEVIQQPGEYPVALVDPSRGLIQSLGTFVVQAPPRAAVLEDGRTSTVFCAIDGWGPDAADAGEAFNRQPNGMAAFWVRTDCAPETARLVLEDVPLPTTVTPHTVTAQVPHYADLGPGDRVLRLHDPVSNEWLEVGRFRAR